MPQPIPQLSQKHPATRNPTGQEPLNQLVIGADGGVGAAYVAACYSGTEDPGTLCLTSRRPVSTIASRVTWLQLDYERDNSLENFITELKTHGSHLDRLIIATGLLHDKGLRPEKSLNQLKQANMQRLFRVNTEGPLSVLAACESMLKKAVQPKICVLSAQVGSIEDNQLGGWYSYRMSKAALNMGIKTAAIEMARWKNDPTIVAVHPGTTHSPLSKPFVARRKAPVQTAATAGKRLAALVDKLSGENSGQFLTLDGQPLPW